MSFIMLIEKRKHSERKKILYLELIGDVSISPGELHAKNNATDCHKLELWGQEIFI
jgi:hypothetical protein